MQAARVISRQTASVAVDARFVMRQAAKRRCHVRMKTRKQEDKARVAVCGGSSRGADAALRQRGRVPVAPMREIVAAPETGPIFRLEYCDVRFWYPLHFHPEIEIKHVVRGAGTRIIGDSIEPFEEGDLCIVGSGVSHCWSSPVVRGRWVRAKVVQFSPELFASVDGRRNAFSEFALLIGRAQRGLQIVGAARSEASIELERLFDARTEARQLAHLVEFLAIVADESASRPLCVAETVEAGKTTRHHLAEQVLKFVKDQVHLPITEEAAAKAFGQSASRFSKFFKREFGVSFSRYVVEMRVGRASNLLLSQPLDVKEIATIVGFGTVASLNRHFRAVKMTTPTAYRRRARELNAGLRAAEGELLRCDGDGRRPERQPAPTPLQKR